MLKTPSGSELKQPNKQSSARPHRLWGPRAATSFSVFFSLPHGTAGGAKPWVRPGVKSCRRRRWTGFKPRYKQLHRTLTCKQEQTHTHWNACRTWAERHAHKNGLLTKKKKKKVFNPSQRSGERVHVCAYVRARVPVPQKRDSCCALQIWRGYASGIGHSSLSHFQRTLPFFQIASPYL